MMAQRGCGVKRPFDLQLAPGQVATRRERETVKSRHPGLALEGRASKEQEVARRGVAHAGQSDALVEAGQAAAAVDG